jgi:uncharacterized protein YbgA (DUF1722 family)/uncharacterized protein YbbK (DUF523 family)
MMRVNDRPRVGISACLLGEAVRFDAGHKRDPFLVETFGTHVEWVPICPEVEAGFGTPRPPMRLVARGNAISLIVIKTGEDVTARLTDYSDAKVEALAGDDLSGYVLKKDSPSCGMERVKTYGPSGPAPRTGRGIFAAALMARFPSLPVEEEGRLNDPVLRENFVERVFAYRRLRQLFETRWSLGQLVRFHTAHKLTLMAHSPAAYRTLGRLVAEGRERKPRELAAEYQRGFMTALTKIATPSRHVNVLQHMVGYFKKTLDAQARAELLDVIEDHRRGVVPLIVPLTLLRHHVRRQRVEYLEGQTYLEPHPRELALRNHV